MKKILSFALHFRTGAVLLIFGCAHASTVNTVETNPAVESQIKGNYGSLERTESWPLGAIQKAWDRADHTAGVYRVIWHPSEIIRFRIREFMTTTLVFPKWERIDEIIVGDESAYAAKLIAPHLVSVRAKDFIGLDSTITLVGASGRVYSFYVRTEGYNTHNIADVTVYIKVRSNGEESTSLLKDADTSNSKTDYLEDAHFDPSQISFGYSMAGNKEIAPERVYGDGIRTWFDYGSRINEKNLPAVFKIEDGIDTPVNVSREGSKIVAQASGSFTLKHGNKTVCVTKTGGKK